VAEDGYNWFLLKDEFIFWISRQQEKLQVRIFMKIQSNIEARNWTN